MGLVLIPRASGRRAMYDDVWARRKGGRLKRVCIECEKKKVKHTLKTPLCFRCREKSFQAPRCSCGLFLALDDACVQCSSKRL